MSDKQINEEASKLSNNPEITQRFEELQDEKHRKEGEAIHPERWLESDIDQWLLDRAQVTPSHENLDNLKAAMHDVLGYAAESTPTT